MMTKLLKIGKMAVRVVTRNVGWKLFSLFLAVLLWSYVISSNPNITRDVTLSGVDVIISGQSVLQGRELALLTDAASELSDVVVKINVTQSDYARVTPDSVRVELDLSRIKQPGVQPVTLTGRSAYGDVVQITPSSIELVVEDLDERSVPVNVYLDNSDSDDYWYSVSQKNPGVISVSGPSSVMREVSSALVRLDATGLTESTRRAEPYTLLTSTGEEITFPLTRSTSTVNVDVSVYPSKKLTLSDDPVLCTTGTLPDGYLISKVELSPATVTVAGEPDLLDALDMLTVAPVDVTGATQSFTTEAALSSTSALKYTSCSSVSVTVYIEQEQTSQRFANALISAKGQSASTKVTMGSRNAEVKTTGPYEDVSALTSRDVLVYVDVTGLEAGEYDLPVQAEIDNVEGLTIELFPQTIHLTITDR